MLKTWKSLTVALVLAALPTAACGSSGSDASESEGEGPDAASPFGSFNWPWETSNSDSGEGDASYTKTKHPIVLVHGLFGFESILGMDYFYQVHQALERGGATVYTAQVAAANTTAVRGEQLLKQLEEWAAADGVEKFNLYCHSHGSPTGRYVASVKPSLVASLSSIGGVVWGSKVADAIVNEVDNSSFDWNGIMDVLNTVLASVYSMLSGGTKYDQDILGAFRDLTTNALTEFNAIHPQGLHGECESGSSTMNIDGHTIGAYSWSGDAINTNFLDLTDVAFAATSKVFGSSGSDGLMGDCATYFGELIGIETMNHIDEVNLMLGLVSSKMDPLTLFRQQANRLKLAGY